MPHFEKPPTEVHTRHKEADLIVLKSQQTDLACKFKNKAQTSMSGPKRSDLYKTQYHVMKVLSLVVWSYIFL